MSSVLGSRQVQKKIARLSYNQLVLLAVFLRRPAIIWTVKELAAGAGIKEKALGGVLSSLSRTKFRDLPLINPMGRSRDGVGLRWQLNINLLDLTATKREVAGLLRSYR